MRKLYFLLLIACMFFAFPSNAAAVRTVHAQERSVVKSKTPVGMIVQGLFRKIFTGKEQMSEKKRRRLLLRQK